MNLIWEIALQAKENGISENDLFFQQASECSPWYEQSFPCINEQEVRSPAVEINSLYRFSDIFQELLHDMDGTVLQRYLFDAAIHLILDRELLAGVSLRDLYIQKLLHELCDDAFGGATAAIYRTLLPKEQRMVASLLLTQFQTGSSLLVFQQAVRMFYPSSILYQFKDQPETLLLYMGCAQTKAPCIQMLQELFLPLQYQVRIFWTSHFGVMGVDPTLHWDVIEIY